MHATTTKYQFRKNNIELDVLFLTPNLLEDIEYLSLPITFIEFSIRNIDVIPHRIRLYYDNSAEPTINKVSENVTW